MFTLTNHIISVSVCIQVQQCQQSRWFMIRGVSKIGSAKGLWFIIDQATRLVVMAFAKEISIWLLIHVV